MVTTNSCNQTLSPVQQHAEELFELLVEEVSSTEKTLESLGFDDIENATTDLYKRMRALIKKIQSQEKITRPTKDEYYLTIAEAVMLRSTCIRRKYGAVIVKNDEIIATGYNGAPRGEENCYDTVKCWRAEHEIPHGERYEACRSVHSEMNAIISASRQEMQGATLYLASDSPNAEPCDICRRLIVNAGISKVITRESVKEVK